MLSSSRLPTVLIAVAAALAIIGATLAATGAADDDSKNLASSSSRRTTTTELRADGGGDGGDVDPLPGVVSPTTGGSGGRSSTTMRATGTTRPPDAPPADCPTPPSTNASLQAPTPPAAGTYEYVSCADANDESDNTKVEEKPGDPQRRLITSNLAGYPQTKTAFYGPNGVFQESFSIGGLVTCDWDPDILELPPTINVGTSWSADSRCTITSPQGTGTLELKASNKVTGKVAFPVGGTPVNAWAIESNAHVKITGKNQRGETQSSEYDIVSRLFYAPAQGVDVYRHLELKTTEGTTTIIDRLKSVTPTKN